MEEIIVTIAPNGGITYKVQGVKGKSCKELTKAIDDMGNVTSSKNTPEFNQLGDTIKLKNQLGG